MHAVPNQPIQPTLDWYVGRSLERGLSRRCPFALVDDCPRYYQSLSLLANAGRTAIAEREEKRLRHKWESSPLWPKTDEQVTWVWRDIVFTNYCPEVAADAFGWFASALSRSSNETDIDIKHRNLKAAAVDAKDWRWTWNHVAPMHYSECPLYSPLLARSAKPSLSRFPRALGEALWGWIWQQPKLVRVLVVGVSGSALLLFAIWRSLPDATKENVLKAIGLI